LALYRLIYFFRLAYASCFWVSSLAYPNFFGKKGYVVAAAAAYASSTSSLFVNLTALLDRGVSSFLARIVEQLKVFCLFVRKELTSL